MKRDFGALLAAVCLTTATLLGWEGMARGDAGAAMQAGGVATNSDAGRYMFEDEIRPGMKGYGLTVMTGGKIEKFDVEVIDVVKNFTPGNNGILIRCSGLGLEHSGIVAGMSGSPVFINDKMIGAVAFGWGMAKDPIAGVQPIRQMLSIPTKEAEAAGEKAGGGRWAGDGVMANEAAKMPGWGALAAAMGKRVGGASSERRNMAKLGTEGRGMRALASPLMVSGASESTMKLLAREMAGTDLLPVAGGSGTATAELGEKSLGGMVALKTGEIQLAPGSAIAVPLVTGDMDLSAIGTVTEVREGKVYAFGHAFLAEGGTKLPMATSYIYTVMPNVSQSFKLGTSLRVEGTLVMDEQTGIVGKVGDGPPMVPVTMLVKNGEVVKSYAYRVAPHTKLMPEILNAVLNETLVAQRSLPPQFTARVTAQVTFAGGKTVKIENLGTTQDFKPVMTLVPIALLVDNPFESLQMTGLVMEATIEHTNKGGTIRSVNVDRLTVAPGDEMHAVAEVERYQKETLRVPVTVKVPADVADGDYTLAVGSATMALLQEADYAPQHFDPQNIGALVQAIEKIEAYRADRIYAALVMNVSGAAAGGQEKPNLPASRVAFYSSGKRTDTAPVMRVATTDADAGAVLDTSGTMFMVHVDHKANERYFEAKSGMGGMGSGGVRQPKLLTTQPPTTSAPGDEPGP